MSEPIQYRLTQTPIELFDRLTAVLSNTLGYSVLVQEKRLRKLVDLTYLRGYQDGYCDGRADAESGHDERVRAVVS